MGFEIPSVESSLRLLPIVAMATPKKLNRSLLRNGSMAPALLCIPAHEIIRSISSWPVI